MKYTRLIALVLAFVLVCSLAACGSKKESEVITVYVTPEPTPEVLKDEQAEQYAASLQLMNEHQYEQAIAALEALGSYSDAEAKLEECRSLLQESSYAKAVSLFEACNYAEAAALFASLGSYKDSADYSGRASELAALAESLRSASKGDIVTFGSFEQDNDPSNGAEALDWIVLKQDSDSLLLISKYILYCASVHKAPNNITWETCQLRSELNSSFYTTAFNEREQSLLLDTNVTADPNPRFHSNAGNDTVDKVWLLSAKEADEYFPTQDSKKAEPTKYAQAGGGSSYTKTTVISPPTYTITGPAGAIVAPPNNSVPWPDAPQKTETETVYIDYSHTWWLRTQGDVNYHEVYINYRGVMALEGYSVNFPQFGVRPVIRVAIGA